MNRKLVLSSLLSFCLFALSARATASEVAPALMFSGALNAQVRVGGAFANGKLALFFCGDAASVSTQTHWLTGAAELDGNWRMLSKDGWAAIVRFNAAQDRLEGWVYGPVANAWLGFAAPVSAEGPGLYRAVDQYGVEGAIVTDLDHNGVFELQGAVKNLSGHFEQIVPIASVEPKDGALVVAVPTETGAFSNVILHQITTIDF